MAQDIVGELISFRGLVYAPLNEQGVVYLFGKVSEDLHIYVEIVRSAFPDCIARRFIGKGWERIGIEFEYKSSDFKRHGHDPSKVDLPIVLVCWEDDWKEDDLKRKLDQVIELRTIIKELPNRPVQTPTEESKVSEQLKHLKKSLSGKTWGLFKELYQKMMQISDEIFPNIGKTVVSYYSPRTRFLTVYFLQNALRIELFTGGMPIEGVKPKDEHPNWGDIRINDLHHIDDAILKIKKSWKLMLEAEKHKLDTSWEAKEGCLTKIKTLKEAYLTTPSKEGTRLKENNS